MRRWQTILICSFALLFLWIAVCRRRSELSYQGKSLTYWLRGFEPDARKRQWQSAEALRNIGTNAMPRLLVQLQHPRPKHESEWRLRLRELLSKQSILKIDVPAPLDERGEALAALDALGPLAKDAVPALEALLHEAHPDHRAIIVLGRIGPNAKPALMRALTNETKVIRGSALVCLEMQETHSDILFPTNATGADFFRRQMKFNLSVLEESYKDYRSQHPEIFSSNSIDGKPPANVPFIPTPKMNASQGTGPQQH